MNIISNLVFLGYEDYIETGHIFQAMKIISNLIFLGHEDYIEPDIF